MLLVSSLFHKTPGKVQLGQENKGAKRL